MPRLIITFVALIIILVGILTAICYFTGHTELLPSFLQPDAAVENIVPAPTAQ